MKITTPDSWFSKCVRKAANWQCYRCGAQHDSSSMGLHCSHIFGRRHRTIRWCKDNVQSLCASCHNWFGENPADSGQWLLQDLGEGHLALLREKRDSKVKVPKTEEKLISKHYREQFKQMADGEDFESWQ